MFTFNLCRCCFVMLCTFTIPSCLACKLTYFFSSSNRLSSTCGQFDNINWKWKQKKCSKRDKTSNIPLQIKNFLAFQNFSWHCRPLGFPAQLSILLPQGELPNGNCFNVMLYNVGLFSYTCTTNLETFLACFAITDQVVFSAELFFLSN